jgi:hypothetical protein
MIAHDQAAPPKPLELPSELLLFPGAAAQMVVLMRNSNTQGVLIYAPRESFGEDMREPKEEINQWFRLCIVFVCNTSYLFHIQLIFNIYNI